MGIPLYRHEDWRLFVDSSKQRLKCVLLLNGKKFVLISTGHSTKLNEEYNKTGVRKIELL